MREDAAGVRVALGGLSRSAWRGLVWGMRKNPSGWNTAQIRAMHYLRQSNLKSARAWTLKMALRDVYAQAAASNDAATAESALRQWLSWARHSRLDSFKKLAPPSTIVCPPSCAACSSTAPVGIFGVPMTAQGLGTRIRLIISEPEMPKLNASRCSEWPMRSISPPHICEPTAPQAAAIPNITTRPNEVGIGVPSK